MASPTNNYSEIWELLKQNGQVTLAVPVQAQKRLLLGLKNIKHRDHVFKLELEARKKRCIMYSKKEQSRIKITLRELEDLYQHLIA